MKKLALIVALSVTGLAPTCDKGLKNFDAYKIDGIVTDLTQEAIDGKLPAYARYSVAMMNYKPFIELEKAISETGPTRSENIVLVGNPSIDVVAPVQALASALNDGVDKRHVYQIHLAKLNKLADEDSFSKDDYFGFIQNKILQHGDPIYFIEDIESYDHNLAKNKPHNEWTAYKGKGYKISVAELADWFVKYDKRIIYTISEKGHEAFFKQHELNVSPAQGSLTDHIDVTPYTVTELNDLLTLQAATYLPAVKIEAGDIERIARLTRAFMPKSSPLKTGLAALQDVYLEAKKASPAVSDEKMVLQTFSGTLFANKPVGELENSMAFKTDSARDIETALRTDQGAYIDEFRVLKQKNRIMAEVEESFKHHRQFTEQQVDDLKNLNDDQRRDLARFMSLHKEDYYLPAIQGKIRYLESHAHDVKKELQQAYKKHYENLKLLNDVEEELNTSEKSAKQVSDKIEAISLQIQQTHPSVRLARDNLENAKNEIARNIQELARLEALPQPVGAASKVITEELRRTAERKRLSQRNEVLDASLSALGAAVSQAELTAKDSLKSQRDLLTHEFKATDERISELRSEKSALAKKISLFTTQKDAFEKRITETTTEIERLETRIADLKKTPGMAQLFVTLTDAVLQRVRDDHNAVMHQIAMAQETLAEAMKTNLDDHQKAALKQLTDAQGKLSGLVATNLSEHQKAALKQLTDAQGKLSGLVATNLDDHQKAALKQLTDAQEKLSGLVATNLSEHQKAALKQLTDAQDKLSGLVATNLDDHQKAALKKLTDAQDKLAKAMTTNLSDHEAVMVGQLAKDIVGLTDTIKLLDTKVGGMVTQEQLNIFQTALNVLTKQVSSIWSQVFGNGN